MGKAAVFWATRRSEGIEPGWVDRGRQPHHFLWMLLAGRAEVDYAGQRFALGPGELFAGRLDRRRLRLSGPSSGLAFQWCSFHLGEDPELPLRPRLLDRGLFDAGFERLVAAFRRDGARAPATLRWLWALVQQLREDNPAGAAEPADDLSAVRACLQAIDADPGADWTVTGVAAACGRSPGHFARQCRRLAGCSPRAYITAARIHAAQDLLRDSALPVGVIAERLGYGDIFHFSKQFRLQVGCCPSDWRQRQV